MHFTGYFQGRSLKQFFQDPEQPHLPKVDPEFPVVGFKYKHEIPGHRRTSPPTFIKRVLKIKV